MMKEKKTQNVKLSSKVRERVELDKKIPRFFDCPQS
jgi:hypothetical protein